MRLPYAHTHKSDIYVDTEDLARICTADEALDYGIIQKGWLADVAHVAGVTELAYLEKAFPYSDGFNGGNGGSFGFTRNRRAISEYSLLQEFSANPLVYRCVEKNATAIASLSWGVYAFESKTAIAKGTSKRKGTISRLNAKEQQRIIKQLKISKPADTEIVRLDSHPLYEIICRNNEDINGAQLFKLTQEYEEILGRAYWYVDEALDGSKRVTSLMPWRVLPLRDSSGYVVAYQYYQYQQGFMIGGNDSQGAKLNELMWIDKENMIDFRFINPSDPYGGGLSPTGAAIRAIYISSQYTDWLNTILSNRQRPDWFLIPTDPNLSDEEVNRAEKIIADKSGGNNNGKPKVLNAAFKPFCMSYTPTDIAPLQVQSEMEKDITGAYGIPSALADSDAATYSNYESALEDWARGAIQPRATALEQILNENLDKLGIEDDVFIIFDCPVPEDKEYSLRESQDNVLKVQWGGSSLTTNEKRALLGFPPTTNPADDELVAPPSPVAPPTGGDNEVDGESDDQGDDSVESNDNDNQDETDDAEDQGKAAKFNTLLKINAKVSNGKLPRAVAISMVAALLDLDEGEAKKLVGYATSTAEQEACGCVKAKEQTKEAKVISQQPKTEDRIKKAVAAWFGDLKTDALKTIRKAVNVNVNVNVNGNGNGNGNDGVVTKADTDNEPNDFVDIDKWIDDLKGTEDDLAYRVKPLIELEAQQSANQKIDALTRVGASPDAFDVVPNDVAAAMDKRAFKFAQSTLATTRKGLTDVVSGIKEMVQAGTLEGSTNDELTNQISAFLENAQQYQAERIARTETSAAVHMGQVISAKASGIVSGFKYLVSSDACDKCLPYANQEIDIGDYDDSGAIDAEGAVPLHPNCGCSLTEIISIGDEKEQA